MADLAPGKGAHLVLNEQALTFLNDAVDDLREVYTDEVHDSDPKAIVTTLCGGSDEDNDFYLHLKWVEVKDKFGHKAYAAMPYRKGELRVTLVLTKQNELRLDIREWYDPNA